MKIGIAGLGAAGSFLLRLLTDNGFDAVGFDPRRPDYYIPCGYATNSNKLKALLSPTGLDFDDYILSTSKEVEFTGPSGKPLLFRTTGFCTYDKNRLELDLISNCRTFKAKFTGEFDLIIDATGVSRSLLPQVEDYRMHTKEYLTELEEKSGFKFRYFSRGSGYFWIFPLGDKYHVGAGSYDLDRISSSLSEYGHQRIMSRDIRLKPLFSSMHTGNVIGVGESIGTVSPITGEGIYPSMLSAQILFQTLREKEDIEQVKTSYTAGIKKEFRRFEILYRLMREAQAGNIAKRHAYSYIRNAGRDLKNFGIEINVFSAIRQMV